MEKILISDAAENAARVAYIYNAASARLPASVSRPGIVFGTSRTAIVASDDPVPVAVKKALSAAAAEAIAVGYKYDYFSSRLRLCKLIARRRKIFLCALIAADLRADAGYIRTELEKFDSCALDGFFAFRLRAMQRKWDKIVRNVPPDFTAPEMDRFMKYLINGNRGKVFVTEDAVYGGDYRACRLSTLTGRECAAESEILLSCANEPHVLGRVKESTVDFLKKYYGSRAVFYAGK